MCVLCIRSICLPCVMVIKRQIYVVSEHFLRQVVKIKNDLTVINIKICMRWSAVHITNVMSIVHITTSTGLFPVYITHRNLIVTLRCTSVCVCIFIQTSSFLSVVYGMFLVNSHVKMFQQLRSMCILVLF